MKKHRAGDADELLGRIAELESLLESEQRSGKGGAPPEIRYDHVFAHLSEAIIVYRDGIILFANLAAANLHGSDSTDQLVGEDILKFVHPDDRERMLSRRAKVMAGTLIEPSVRKGLCLDGAEITLESRGSPIHWDGGPAVFLVLRDVTERTKAEEALLTSERIYRELIEGSPFGIQVSRVSGKRLFVNLKFVEMFGFDSAQEVLSITKAGVLIAPHDRDRMIAHREVRERGEATPDTFEYDALRKDGSIMPVQVFIRYVSWEGETAVQRTFLDVTDRKKAEEAQRESEERYRLMAEQSPDGIMVQADYIIQFANPGLARILGAKSPEELIGRHLLDFIAPEEHDSVRARRKKAKAGGNVEMAEATYLRVDGSPTFVERTATMIPWQGKQSFLTLVRDINQRKQTEERMREQSALLETVMNSMDPMLTAWDKDQKLVAWNKKWEVDRKFPKGFLKPGIPYEEIIRWSYKSGRRKSDDVEATIAKRLIGVQETTEPEPIFELPDGTVILRKRHPLPDGGFVITQIDITELKKAQDASRESEERYRSLVEFVPEPVLVTDRGEILYCNPAAIELFGADDLDQLIGKNHLEMIHKDDRSVIAPRLKKSVVEGPVTRIQEVRSLRLDGAEFTTETYSAPFVWNGMAVRLVIMRDISDRRKAELERERMVENLLEAQKRIEEQTEALEEMAARSDQAMREAQAADQAKSEFLALMSHELRTPLNAILGFSDIMEKQTFGPLGDVKYREYAKDINDSGQHLLDLINDILDLAKVESGKDEIYEEEIEVNELISQLITLVKGRAEREQIILLKKCPVKIVPLYADKRKLKQILVNLLSNAIKFSPAGGTVELKVWRRPKGGHVFQVADSGIGIAREDIPTAMAPFRQVASDINRSRAGTGLGLPLSKALVELHGGSLELQSEVNGGTKITIRLPPERTRPHKG